MVAYVDGSYDRNTGRASWAAVLLFEDDQELTLSGSFTDSSNAWNVAGELMAVQKAMEFSLSNNYKTLEIHYDYQGIESWATGEWKTNKLLTKSYKTFYDFVSSKLQVTFVKVKAHSGNRYNELADALAKSALRG